MTPAGYMAKRIESRPDWLKEGRIVDIYSVASCISHDFADYLEHWKHNGHWLFNSPEIIREIAQSESISLTGTKLFYYEMHGMEFDEGKWREYSADPSFTTNVLAPEVRHLEGFDVVTFWAKNLPEHSPLSCNSLAETIPTNAHCLFETFGAAELSLNAGALDKSEPGPYRIFAVYSVNWPESTNERN